jgi:5S rRNA maturation endonuclease (ribonuclease M5)
MNKYFDLWDNQEKRKITVKIEKKEGKDWVAFCPFHSDQNRPNLHIDEEKKTYHCFACNRKGFLYNPEYQRSKGRYGKRIIAAYNYQDEQGKLLHQVIRYDPKGFSQRRPDGKGGWINNLKGINTVPYRLPELIKEKDTVFIVEGEKDADNLRRWGLTVTTSPMGANKWKSQYNKYFKAKKIVLLPDHDGEGLNHMRVIAKELSGETSSIKLLKLPGLKEKEDVTDWIKKGGTKEELLKLIEDTPKLNLKDIKGLEQKPKNKKMTEKTKTLIPGIIHLVQEQGQIKYLVKEDKFLKIQEIYQEDNIIYRPKQILPFKLLTTSIVNSSFDFKLQKLFNEVDCFIRSYLEMPDEKDYLILVLWVFHTYLIEKFDVSPMLYFYGVKETGKTRAGEVLAELGFRAERITSVTEASLFRSADIFKPTMIIDEIKLWGKRASQGLQDLLKTVYKRGLKVTRINNDKKGEDQIEYFDTFSPVVICTTETLPDIIESRCIHFIMQKNLNPKIEQSVDQEWANDLRERLTLFRAKFIDQKMPEVTPIARGRLQEIIGPLHQISKLVCPDKEKDLIEIVKKINKTKAEEEGMSLEAEIVSAVYREYLNTQEANILTRTITAHINNDRGDNDKKSDSLISRSLKRLGFEKIRFKDGKMGFHVKENLLEKLKKQFQIGEDSEGSEGYEGK